MLKKLPKFIMEKDLFLVRTKTVKAVENQNVALYEYRFCMSHPKGQRSPMGYDLLELSTGKTLKNVTNIDKEKICRKSLSSFRDYKEDELKLDNHYCYIVDYFVKTYNELGSQMTMHWTSQLIALEKKLNEAELKLYSKSIDKFSKEQIKE